MSPAISPHSVTLCRRASLDGDDLREQLEDGRMQRIVEIGQLIVVAVDRERVLDQIVGADRDEVELADHARQRDRGSGHFDHRAELDVLGDLVTFGAQIARAFVHADGARLAISSPVATIGTSMRTCP